MRDLGSSSPTNSSASESEREADGKFDFRSVLKKRDRIKKRPEVIWGLQDVRAVEGESVKLTCTITGVPQPTVLWYAGHKEIKVKSKHYNILYLFTVLYLYCICHIILSLNVSEYISIHLLH